MINLIHGDCLEEMKKIPDQSVDMVLTDYKNGLSMRQISKKLNTNHKLIGRILKRNNIATRKPKNLRGKRKFSCEIDLKYNNMITHLRFRVSLEWVKQFSDFEKLKCLNSMATDRGRGTISTTEVYVSFVEKFYNDKDFNAIYRIWVSHGKKKLLKPTIDHIVPKCRGGKNELENYQILSWFENRCKNNMSQKEWENIKLNLKDYLL